MDFTKQQIEFAKANEPLLLLEICIANNKPSNFADTNEFEEQDKFIGNYFNEETKESPSDYGLVNIGYTHTKDVIWGVPGAKLGVMVRDGNNYFHDANGNLIITEENSKLHNAKLKDICEGLKSMETL